MGENCHLMTNTPEKFDLYFILPSYVELSMSDDPIKMHKIFSRNKRVGRKKFQELSSPVAHGQSKQFRVKRIKEINIQQKL